MTDIKLRPDCELAKALENFAVHNRRHEHAAALLARVHLLEVIQNGSAKAARRGDEEDCREADAYMRIANEIMGVLSDD